LCQFKYTKVSYEAPGEGISTITRALREKLLFFDDRRGKKFGRRFLAVTLFMEEHVRFMDLKVLNDKRPLTIASSLVTVVPALVVRNYTATVVCTDKASNEVSMFNESHMFSLPGQSSLPTI
jgi:hypothetical protein